MSKTQSVRYLRSVLLDIEIISKRIDKERLEYNIRDSAGVDSISSPLTVELANKAKTLADICLSSQVLDL